MQKTDRHCQSGPWARHAKLLDLTAQQPSIVQSLRPHPGHHLQLVRRSSYSLQQTCSDSTEMQRPSFGSVKMPRGNCRQWLLGRVIEFSSCAVIHTRHSYDRLITYTGVWGKVEDRRRVSAMSHEDCQGPGAGRRRSFPLERHLPQVQ